MLTITSSYEVELEELLSETAAEATARERSAFDAEIAATSSKVVLFGAGNLGRQALVRLRQAGLEPLAFADNRESAWGTRVDSVEVLAPGEAARRFGQDATFVVTIWNATHRYVETRKQLANLGCAHVMPVSKLRWKYPETFLPFYFEDQPHKVLAQAEQVRAAMALWADDFSRREYLAQVRWRLRADFDALSAPVADESYFLPEVFALAPGESFVDCGAFDGVTVRSFLKRAGSSFRNITAVEPDPINCGLLREYVAGLPRDLRSRIDIVQKAVARSTGTVRFDPLGTLGSAIKADGKIDVDSITLDDLVSETKPTFIKMDIEGAEPDALEGGRAVIGRHQPILAICLYHQQDHLWNLPLLISELGDSYKLFMRPHECDGWQLVCYAVPCERLEASCWDGVTE
jgi:FkbM family methyltransferase